MAWWRPHELRAFVRLVANHELGPLFRLAGATGMRRGELVGLRWIDVDLERQRIDVRQQITSTDYIVRRDQPKSDRGLRVVTLDPDTADVLGSLPRHPSGYVFVDATGQPRHPESIARIFTRLATRSALPRIRFHDLRHSHVAHLIEANIDPLTISRRLGHASVAFTLDRYGHLFDQAGATAAQAVSQLLRPQPGDPGFDEPTLT